MSSGRLFQSFGPAEANERSPTRDATGGHQVGWKSPTDNNNNNNNNRIVSKQTG